MSYKNMKILVNLNNSKQQHKRAFSEVWLSGTHKTKLIEILCFLDTNVLGASKLVIPYYVFVRPCKTFQLVINVLIWEKRFKQIANRWRYIKVRQEMF